MPDTGLEHFTYNDEENPHGNDEVGAIPVILQARKRRLRVCACTAWCPAFYPGNVLEGRQGAAAHKKHLLSSLVWLHSYGAYGPTDPCHAPVHSHRVPLLLSVFFSRSTIYLNSLTSLIVRTVSQTIHHFCHFLQVPQSMLHWVPPDSAPTSASLAAWRRSGVLYGLRINGGIETESAWIAKTITI